MPTLIAPVSSPPFVPPVPRRSQAKEEKTAATRTSDSKARFMLNLTGWIFLNGATGGGRLRLKPPSRVNRTDSPCVFVPRRARRAGLWRRRFHPRRWCARTVRDVSCLRLLVSNMAAGRMPRQAHAARCVKRTRALYRFRATCRVPTRWPRGSDTKARRHRGGETARGRVRHGACPYSLRG